MLVGVGLQLLLLLHSARFAHTSIRNCLPCCIDGYYHQLQHNVGNG